MIPEFISVSFRAAANAFNRSLTVIHPFKNAEGYAEANLTQRFSNILSALGSDVFFEAPLPNGRLDVFALYGGIAIRIEAKQLDTPSVASLAMDHQRLSELDTHALVRQLRGNPAQITNSLDVLLCDCWTDAHADWWLGRPSATTWDRSFLAGYDLDAIRVPNGFKGERGQYQYWWLIAVRPSLVCSSTRASGDQHELVPFV